MTARATLPLLFAFLLHLAAAPCPAQAPQPRQAPNASATKLTVQIGWGDKVRAGRWAPVFVTTSNPRTQPAVVEVYAQQNGADAMLVHQFLTIGPVATTVTLYVPVQFNGDQGPVVILRDEATGRTLAHYPPDPNDDGFSSRIVNGGTAFIGLSGQSSALNGLIAALSDTRIEIGFLDPDLLPASAVGYEGLNLLVLNRPDLLHLPGSQQRAIVDWVHSGGNLILWPGDDPAPRTGPLVEALPCRIGGGRNATIPEAELRRLGLPARFAAIRGRRLEPVPQTGASEASGWQPPPERIVLFGPENEPDNFAYRRQLGLGQILVTPVDVSELRFDDTASAARFWQPLLVGMSILPHEPGDDPRAAAFPRYNADQDIRRRYAAARVLERFLASHSSQAARGALPGETAEAGEGGSGFPNFLVALLAMMVVAGPMDSFVLRRLGRRPWTWVTVTAWLVLLLGGGFYFVHALRSRPLSYQTIRVIDQTDRGTVAETSLICIDPARTADYHLTAPPDAPQAPPASAPTGPTTAPTPPQAGNAPDASAPPPAPGWWSAVGTDEDGSRRGMIHDIPFHQTDRGNAPDAMHLKAGALRFLRQDSAGGGAAPVLQAALSVASGAASDASPSPLHVNGTIQNLTANPLLHVRVRTRQGATPPIERIEPGASASVDVDVAAGPGDPFSDADPDPSIHYARDPSPIASGSLWQVVGDLAGARSRRIDDLLGTGRYACVYAETANPAPPAALQEPGGNGAQQKHYELIRAVVPVNAQGEKR